LDQAFRELLATTDVALLQKQLLEAPENLEYLGGKCILHLPWWAATCGGVEFMRMGMTHDWSETDPPPDWLTNPDPPRYYEYTGDPTHEEAFWKLVKEELDQKLIRIVHHNFVKLYNPSFPVPKKGSDSWRKVLDLRVLNLFQKDIHFKMEGPEDLIQMARKDDYATSLDLKNAFNHLIVHEDLQPYLCFAFRGVSYAYRCMPFGAKHAPRLFTKALSYAIAFIRQNWEARILTYMDHIIILHQNKDYLAIATLQIAICLQKLGWTVNLKKSELTPSQTINILGWNWSFPSLSLQMTSSIRHSLSILLKEWRIESVIRSESEGNDHSHPRNLISWEGVSSDFLRLTVHPNFCK
jgi:hypothetical protein